MADPQRLIAHLDMDAFYASVALLRYPELRGRAVVIGGGSRHLPVEMPDGETGKTVRRFAALRDYAGRGVVMTATYEARARGLNSALGLMKAAAIAPDVILLPTDFEAYRRYSHLFKAAVRTLAPEVEDRGIDEIYIDLTGVDCPYRGLQAREPSPDAWQRAREVAQAIKDAVRAATGLSCSIGVAPNKLLAKIASDLDKPDGLTMLAPADIPARIWPLPARKVNGIGPKSSARLEALGITTIGELAQADPARLIEHFGENYGTWLHNVAHGRDARSRAVVADLHRPLHRSQRGPVPQGLRRKDDRLEAALRQLQDRHARPDARPADTGPADDPAHRRRMLEARAARPAHSPARRACRCTDAGGRIGGAARYRAGGANRVPLRLMTRAIVIVYRYHRNIQIDL
jgi:DNA polymerase-4